MRQKKIWFIDINGQQEGPYTAYQLKKDRRITPDTLVWKEGFTAWVAISDVEELKEIFEDERPQEPQKDEGDSKREVDDAIALDYGFDPRNFTLWVIIAMIVLLYVIFQLYGCR